MYSPACMATTLIDWLIIRDSARPFRSCVLCYNHAEHFAVVRLANFFWAHFQLRNFYLEQCFPHVMYTFLPESLMDCSFSFCLPVTFYRLTRGFT